MELGLLFYTRRVMQNFLAFNFRDSSIIPLRRSPLVVLIPERGIFIQAQIVDGNSNL